MAPIKPGKAGASGSNVSKENDSCSESEQSEESAKSEKQQRAQKRRPSTGRSRRGKSDSTGVQESRSSRSKQGGAKNSSRSGSKPRASRREKSLAEILPGTPIIVPRDEHPISRKNIDEDALKVLYRLNNNGHQAFIVGGGVRDLYLGKTPKDFDIATSASPEEVRSLFRNSRIIGRRFKLNHIYFRGGKIIELATFRSDQEEDSVADEMLKSDNTWGDAQTDARRRDLTVNALFYDVETFSIIDYVGGIEDLKRGAIRFIGVPKVRVQEDPVRMIRVLRHAARIGFSVEADTYDAVCEFPALLKHCPLARLYEELLKDLRSGASRAVIPLYRDSGLLKYLTPSLSHFIDGDPQVWQRLLSVMSMIDKHVIKLKTRNSNVEVPPSVLLASVFLGNIPSEVLISELESEKDRLVFETLWSDEPFSEGSSSEQYLLEEGKMKVSAEVKDAFRSLLGKLFRPIGVSKKDCEYIERMLILRLKMFEVFAGGQDSRLVYLDAFSDTLNLLDLTSQTAFSEENYDFWYSQKDKYIKKRRPNRRYR